MNPTIILKTMKNARLNFEMATDSGPILEDHLIRQAGGQLILSRSSPRAMKLPLE